MNKSNKPERIHFGQVWKFIGDDGWNSGMYFLLCQVDEKMIALISLEDTPNRYTKPVKINCLAEISKKEWKKITLNPDNFIYISTLIEFIPHIYKND